MHSNARWNRFVSSANSRREQWPDTWLETRTFKKRLRKLVIFWPLFSYNFISSSRIFHTYKIIGFPRLRIFFPTRSSKVGDSHQRAKRKENNNKHESMKWKVEGKFSSSRLRRLFSWPHSWKFEKISLIIRPEGADLEATKSHSHSLYSSSTGSRPIGRSFEESESLNGIEEKSLFCFLRFASINFLTFDVFQTTRWSLFSASDRLTIDKSFSAHRRKVSQWSCAHNFVVHSWILNK